MRSVFFPAPAMLWRTGAVPTMKLGGAAGSASPLATVQQHGWGLNVSQCVSACLTCAPLCLGLPQCAPLSRCAHLCPTVSRFASVCSTVSWFASVCPTVSWFASVCPSVSRCASRVLHFPVPFHYRLHQSHKINCN